MQCKVDFPIISDSNRIVSQAYNMLDFQEPINVDKNNVPYTHRSVYIIDPKNIIRYENYQLYLILYILVAQLLFTLYRLVEILTKYFVY